MKKSVSINIISFLCIFGGWAAVLLIYTHVGENMPYFWYGFGFAAAALVISIFSVAVIDPYHNPNVTEIKVVPIIYTTIYFIAAMIVNTVFLFLNQWEMTIVPVIVNIVIIAVFLLVRIGFGMYANGAEDTVEEAKYRIGSTRDISSKVFALMQQTNDEEVRNALKRFSEEVRYSSNASSDGAIEAENQIRNNLMLLEDAMQRDLDKGVLLGQINEIMKIWNQRSTFAG